MLISAYQRVDSAKQPPAIPGVEAIPELDRIWVETTTAKANSRLESLLAEFKRQKDEAVKVFNRVVQTKFPVSVSWFDPVNLPVCKIPVKILVFYY